MGSAQHKNITMDTSKGEREKSKPHISPSRKKMQFSQGVIFIILVGPTSPQLRNKHNTLNSVLKPELKYETMFK
jgi:hypothetical protein